MDLFVDYKDFARVFGFTEDRVKELVDDGTLPGILDKDRDVCLIAKGCLQRMIANLEEDRKHAKEKEG